MRTTGRTAKPLAYAYPLEAQEPAAGFAARLAALNGRSLWYFLRDMSIPPRALDKGVATAVRAVAVLGRADPEALSWYTPVPKDTGFYSVAGETIGRLSVSRTYFRFCARCVLDDMERYDGPPASRPWLRLEWTLSHFRSCGRHKVLLSAVQPVRRPFAPFDFSGTMHGMLSSLPQLAEDASPVSASPFQGWLQDRLRGVRSTLNWLDDMPLYAAATFCEALGVSSLHEPKVRTASLSMSDWAAAADEGYRLAAAGEESLRVLLGRLNEAQSSTRGFWGPRDTYGYAYGLLQKTVGDPAYGKLRNTVRRFALETMPIEPGTDVLGETAGPRHVHTVRTASRDSRMHALTIRRLFKRMGVEGAEDQSGLMDHRVLVKSEEIHRVVSELRDAITAPQVERTLGVPRLHLKELVARGYLHALAGTGSRRNAKRRFSKVDVESLRARMFEGACEVEKPAPRQLDVVGTRRAATCSIPDLLDMIFRGQLCWKGRLTGRNDYMALLLDADEVTAVVRSRETRAGLTKQEAETFIPGAHGDAVRALIRSGHLLTEEEFNPEARRMTTVVTRESAEAFRSSFVTLGELCQQSGLHHKKVRLLLRIAGIETSLDPDSYGTFFYSRDYVMRAAANPKFWTYEKSAAQKKLRTQQRTIAHLRNASESRSDRAPPFRKAEPPADVTSGPGVS